MVVVVSEQAFNLSTGEAEAADLSEFHSRVAWSTDEFQDLQGNTEKPCRKNNQSVNQKTNRTNKNPEKKMDGLETGEECNFR